MVIAYLRVSTARQHIRNQRQEILHYAQTKELIIDHWISDTVSGKTESSERNLGETLSRLKKGDILIVTELSRLSRSLHEIMQIMKYCVENNVEVHSTKDGYIFDDSINSKVLSFAFGLAAEIEHKLISQRTREAMAVRKAEGKHMGRSKGTGKKRQVLQQKQEWLIEQLKTGRPLKAICRELGVSYHTLHRLRKTDAQLDGLIKDRGGILGGE